MRYIFFFVGILNYLGFAYAIENNRGFMTWVWLGTSLFFFINSYIRYKHDMKEKELNQGKELIDEEDNEILLQGYINDLKTLIKDIDNLINGKN